MTFGFLNILVGMIMDNVLSTVRQLEAEKAHIRKTEQMMLAHKLSEIMFEIDSDGDGCMSLAELRANGKGHEDLLHAVSNIGLPHGFSLDDLHMMLDEDGSGSLSREEFLDGMFRLVLNTPFQRDC